MLKMHNSWENANTQMGGSTETFSSRGGGHVVFSFRHSTEQLIHTEKYLHSK